MFVPVLIFLLTLGSGIAGWAVWTRQPLGFQVGDAVAFLARPGEVALLWGVAVITLLAVWRLRGRAARLAAAGGGLVVLLALLLAPTIATGAPERVAMGGGQEVPPPERRTLVIGVDALSWNRLLPLVAEGRLPSFARLMEEGSYGVLHSHRTYRATVDKEGYWSPVVWTSIATGVTVDKHGIDDFAVLGDDGKRKPAMTWHRKVPAFWNIFSAFQRPVGVVGWWASWPAEDVRGVMVSSNLGLRGHRGIRHIGLDDKAWLRKRRKLTFPEHYKHVVADEVGLPRDMAAFVEREVFPLDRYPIRDGADRETILSVLWQDRLFVDTTIHLLETERFEVYSTYIEGIDVVGHQFWEFMAHPEEFARQARFHVPAGFDLHRRIVDRYYEIVDGYVGELLTAAGDDMTILVVSDHGFQADPDHPRKADHSGFGAILARGEGIRAGHALNLDLAGSVADWTRGRVDVLDVLPTLLYLHGLPISRELDGDVLYRMIEPSWMERHPELTVPTYGDFEASREIEIDAGDTAEYMERLRALGYVE